MLAFMNKFAEAGTFTDSNTTFKNVDDIAVATSTASGWEGQFVISGLSSSISSITAETALNSGIALIQIIGASDLTADNFNVML